MKYEGKTGEYFEVCSVTNEDNSALKHAIDGSLILLWFEGDNNQLNIDGVSKTFNTNDINFLTPFHNVEVVQISTVKVLKFNKPFFCVVNHDSEVGCKGILYYGATTLPIIQVSDPELEILSAAWKMLCIEMESKDELQLEMLQMMLKRILILCTRIYKEQSQPLELDHSTSDVIREFNYLVEQHFKTKHAVSEYAELLFKSPKTLSNVFKKLGNKSPLEFIQNRILLEAKRLLSYTDKGISDIAYEVGYEDVQSFSRFFKKKENVSPSEFKSQHQ